MNSFTSLPSTTSSHPSYYGDPSIPTTTASTASTVSQPLFNLQFAPEVSVTDNQQFHQLLQHHQNLVLQQQQQQQQQQVMYDQRRDSTSSSSGQANRRTQSKAEKRAEHNAIERARREGLNTRFLQLAHLLPNLHHDTRPSKGTIIERTLEFVKDAIQKEERYRHEIKDLRHTNRQLLKQLTHLTTGQDSNSEVMDSDDQLTVKASSPILNASLDTSPLPITRGSSPSSLSSGDCSPPPSLMSSQPQEQQINMVQQKPQQNHLQQLQQQQQNHHHHHHHHHTSENSMPQFNSTATNLQPRQRQQQQQQRRSRVIKHNETSMSTTQHHTSVHHTPSLSSFSSEVWHQPSTHPFWPQQKQSSTQQPPALSFQPSVPNKHGPHYNGDLFAPSIPVSTTQPLTDHQYIQTVPSPEDVDMKSCDLNGIMIKENCSFVHHQQQQQQQQPDFFLPHQQHTIMPNGFLQDPTRFTPTHQFH